MADLSNPEVASDFAAGSVLPDTASPVSWTASEYVAHQKTGGWFTMVAVATVVIATLVFLLTRSYVSVAAMVVGGVLFAMYGAKPPRQLEYQLDHSGLKIGDKHYTFGGFRSFSVMPEGAFSSILFMPLKRFAMPLSIYFAPEDQEKIVNALSAQLPMENRQHDWIDRLMQRIGF